MDHLFLSDVHIGAFPRHTDHEIKQDLISLIDHCKLHDIQIHILGDLFDYWMEYPSSYPSIGDEVLEHFAEYMQSRAPVNFITGNHDNWTTGYFEKLGFSVSHEFIDLTLDGKRYFLHHGDGLKDPEFNLPRPFMHRILRNKFFITMYQKLMPPSLGLKLMIAVSKLSKKRAFSDPSILDRWAKEFLKSTRYDVMLCGHDHHPRAIDYNEGTYINLGTFFEHRTVVLYTNNQLELVVWNAENREFSPYNKKHQAKPITAL